MTRRPGRRRSTLDCWRNRRIRCGIIDRIVDRVRKRAMPFSICLHDSGGVAENDAAGSAVWGKMHAGGAKRIDADPRPLRGRSTVAASGTPAQNARGHANREVPST